jgi:hypothetical protein
MEGLGLAACADLYSWLLREAPAFPAAALRANKHWLMYSFSCPARSAPSCIRPRSRGRSCAYRRCWPCANAACLCARSRCDFAAGAKGTCANLATPKPLRPLLASATTLRRLHDAALHLRAPKMRRQWRQRQRRQQCCEQAPTVRATALARPNVRHERRQKGAAFLTSARWRG